MKDCSILIPAYNEEKGIERVLAGLKEIIDDGTPVIVIDDGSTDGTVNIVKKFPKVTLVEHPYNKGYGSALKTGIRKSRTPFLLTMDSDGQHRVEDVKKLLDSPREFDLVIGAREKGKSFQYLSRAPGKWLLSKVANYLVGFKIQDLNSGLRLFDRFKALEFISLYPNGFSLSTTITLAFITAGYNLSFVPIRTVARVGRVSNVKMVIDGSSTLLLILRVIMLFNPLKIFFPLSLLLFIPGFLFAFSGIVFYQRVPQTSVITILTSILVFGFGIIADQIAALRRGTN